MCASSLYFDLIALLLLGISLRLTSCVRSVCTAIWYKKKKKKQEKMPLDTVLCLDTSSSMGWNNGEGINQLKLAASKFMDGVEETASQAGLKVSFY